MSYAVRAEAAEAVVAEIATAGGRAIAVEADVADSAAVEAMVAHTEAELGPVTIPGNNVGVAWQGTLDTYDREQVARMRQVNVDGVIHATRAVMGSMRARRSGRIVNLALIAAIGAALSGNAFFTTPTLAAGRVARTEEARGRTCGPASAIERGRLLNRMPVLAIGRDHAGEDVLVIVVSATAIIPRTALLLADLGNEGHSLELLELDRASGVRLRALVVGV